MNLKLLILTLVAFAASISLQSSDAFSWMPPEPNVYEAVSDAKALFVGRIIAIEEVKSDGSQVEALATVEVIHCYFGLNKSKGDNIQIRYVSNSIRENVVPVRLSVSSEVLFITNKNVTDEYEFDSLLEDGVDYAFEVRADDVINTFASPFESSVDSIRLINVYWHKHYMYVDKSKLMKLSEERDQ